MIAAALIALDLRTIGEIEIKRIRDLIRRAGLPTVIKGVRLPDIYRSHLRDKKFAGSTNRFILPLRIGAVKAVTNVPDRAIRNALKECATY
jgi:3-dehydroquinate synthetase